MTRRPSGRDLSRNKKTPSRDLPARDGKIKNELTLKNVDRVFFARVTEKRAVAFYGQNYTRPFARLQREVYITKLRKEVANVSDHSC